MRTTPTPLNIGQVPQLFFDNYVIEMVNFVTRTMHQPKKHPGNPLLRQDKPWEKVVIVRGNTSVYWDESERLFKYWYGDWGWDYEAFMSMEPSEDNTVHWDFYKTTDHRVLYAESRDGIRWEKPELDYRSIDGRKTNICLGNEEHAEVASCSVLLDPFETEDSRRYKAIYWTHKGDPQTTARIATAHSPDGRVWTPYDEPFRIREITERQQGDVIILSADTVSGEYYLDTRARGMQHASSNPKHDVAGGWGPGYYPGDPWRMTKRRVFSTNSRDINNWPMLREMLVPDDTEDNLDDEFYLLARFRMGDLHVAFLNIFGRTHNMMTVHLLYSRDGYHWDWTSRGRPFLNVSPEGEWDCFMVEVGSRPMFLDDEIRIYYGGSNLHHDWWMFGEKEGLDVPEARAGWNGGESALGVATLRPEGFVSIDSTVREGMLITRPFVSDGARLVVNAVCEPKGYLDVELSDANDDVVPGYERSACETFRGDSNRHMISWGGSVRLPAEVLTKGAKLRFFIRHCSLYSFRIAAEVDRALTRPKA